MKTTIDYAIKNCIKLAIEQKFRHGFTKHIHVSAIVSNQNEVIYGLNIPKSGIICSEMVALGQALLNNNYTNLLYIVTISLDDNNQPFIANMCGNCRQNFHYICPQIKIVLGDLDNYSMVDLVDLLPYPHIKKKENK